MLSAFSCSRIYSDARAHIELIQACVKHGLRGRSGLTALGPCHGNRTSAYDVVAWWVRRRAATATWSALWGYGGGGRGGGSVGCRLGGDTWYMDGAAERECGALCHGGMHRWHGRRMQVRRAHAESYGELAWDTIATQSNAAIAQLAARRSHNPKVVSSILTGRTHGGAQRLGRSPPGLV